MCRRDLFVSAETFSEAALTRIAARIAADLLLFQRRLVAGMLRLVTRSLRADLFRFYVATIHKRHEGMVASFICCHRLCISNPAIRCNVFVLPILFDNCADEMKKPLSHVSLLRSIFFLPRPQVSRAYNKA